MTTRQRLLDTLEHMLDEYGLTPVIDHVAIACRAKAKCLRDELKRNAEAAEWDMTAESLEATHLPV